MRLFKGLTAAAIAAALLVVPAGALAKGRDRDHDRMPDKWEKKHHLNPRANDARKDPDRDHLSNLSEFRHHTDPQKADSDNDGVDDNVELRDDTNPNREDSDNDGVGDADEISGTIVSFDSGLLTIQLPGNGAGTISGNVNDATEIECDDDAAQAPTASASEDGGSSDNSGPGSTDDNSGPGSTGDDNSGSGSTTSGTDDGANHDAGDDDQNENSCTSGDLKQGAVVHEAKLTKAGDGSNVFTKIELVPAA